MPRKTRIQVRRDTGANWTSVNPTLASGEIGFEKDSQSIKIGDGSTAWTELPYLNSEVPYLVRTAYLNRSQVSLVNDSSKQSIFGLANGTAVEANTRYAYVIRYRVRATADSVNLFYALEGTAGFSFHQYDFNVGRSTYGGAFSPVTKSWITATADNQVRSATHISYGEVGGSYWRIDARGIFDTTNAGFMKPMTLCSPAPGAGSYVEDGAYIEIIKLGPASSGNTAIGIWS